MIYALETHALSKDYGRASALKDCSLKVPLGTVTGLVGPNGAGKSTLLNLAMGLLTPSQGEILVCGYHPVKEAKALLPKVGFVAQDHALYKSFTVREMLAVGQRLNAHWDESFAFQRLSQLEIPLQLQVSKLSGGQQAQVALIMALAKRPELLLLDEPVASLDPLARREFQQLLMNAVAEEGLTVILSSHNVADLERFCDYLVILSSAHVQVEGYVEKLLKTHKLLIGPRDRAHSMLEKHPVITSSFTEKQATLLVNLQFPLHDPAWGIQDVSLEDLILAYLTQTKVEKRETLQEVKQ